MAMSSGALTLLPQCTVQIFIVNESVIQVVYIVNFTLATCNTKLNIHGS